MEQLYFDALKELSACSFLPGSFDKRFVRDLSSKPLDAELSPKQIRLVKKMYYRYRRQILARKQDARFDWTFDADEDLPLDTPRPPKPTRERRERYGKWTDKIADFWKA